LQEAALIFWTVQLRRVLVLPLALWTPGYIADRIPYAPPISWFFTCSRVMIRCWRRDCSRSRILFHSVIDAWYEGTMLKPPCFIFVASFWWWAKYDARDLRRRDPQYTACETMRLTRRLIWRHKPIKMNPEQRPI